MLILIGSVAVSLQVFLQKKLEKQTALNNFVKFGSLRWNTSLTKTQISQKLNKETPNQHLQFGCGQKNL